MRTPIPRSFDVPRGAEPLEAVAQCSERGLLLFDESARVIAFNRSAASLLRRFAAMSLRPLDSTADGAYRLSGADAVLPAYVEQAVADCAQRLTPGRGGGPAVPLARTLRLGARADRGALVMRLSPVGAQDGTEAAPAARVLAILGPIATHPAVDADQLRELFDLSSASARVAVAYLQVDSVKDAARALGISANTVKSHLAALYARTGCSRQSQLVRLLMRLSTPASPRRLGSVAD